MVNYVLSFCKITGASKIFSRNFYLPLLKPLTPKEALRTFRITGKWLLGAKIQHYIPVLLNHKKKRSKKAKNYGARCHEEMEDYTYMAPVLDSENESHKLLLAILAKKNENNGGFVYTVEDKKYNIVLEANLEVAIRDGDIIDVLVSQRTDKIIVKLANFKKIPIEIQYFEQAEGLYCGEGATSPDEEKFHHHGKYTMSLAKIFEDKEMVEEKWEEELRKIMRRRRRQAKEGSKEWKEMMKESIKNLDWSKFEEEAKKVIDEIEEPAEEQDIDMEIDDLEDTKDINETMGSEDMLGKLPTMKEIPDIIKNMGSATFEIMDVPSAESLNRRRVSGVRVLLASGKECFISGQMVHTEEGDVFVPGQTVENEFGLEYSPGITININNKPTLISGLIMGEEERDPMFLPTQSTITADGQLTFAATPEERPKLEPEQQEIRKMRREQRKKKPEEMEVEEIKDDLDSVSSDQPMESISSVELNNSELEELDIEAMRLKQEQQRLEIEKLKSILFDDGMDELVASLEEKKAKLKQKLEELRRLSISTENSLVSYVNESHTMEIASRVTQDMETINRISDILLTMTRRAATFRDRNSVNADNINQAGSPSSDAEFKLNNTCTKLKVLLKTAMVAANDVFKTRPKDQMLALNTLSEILIDELKADSKVLKELLELMNTSVERDEMCSSLFKQLTQNIADTKMALLGNIASRNLSVYDVIETIAKIFKHEDDIQGEAFIKIAKLNPDVIAELIENVNGCRVKTEEEAMELLQSAIVAATKALAKSLLYEEKPSGFEEEATCFAQALGATNPIHERMIIIRMLAERDFSLKSAIERIKKNPERAKSDPRIRQLIRESAVLLFQEPPLRTSRDIPLSLMKTQNLLAIEDFLVQHAQAFYPVLISRNSHQAVIPKEAARGVLAGRVPYALIDESGITHFRPITKNREKRIDDYLNGPSESAGIRNRKYMQSKANGSDASWRSPRSHQTMSSGSLNRGYAGPRA